MFAVAEGAEFEDAGGTDDAGPVDAQEFGGVQFSLEGVHGFADEMGAAAEVQFGVIASGAAPVRVFREDDLHT